MTAASAFTCNQGHRWTGDGRAACPVCGEPALALNAVTLSAMDLVDESSASSESDATLPQHEPREPGPPPAVAGFDIERELGRGGMGVVYLARQRELNRHVALKMILAGLHASAPERERFRIEAQAAAQLQHPNIVQIYDIGEADGRPYLALEFVPGGSLAAHLHGQPWPAREAAALLEPLARAIHHAHQRGIIHRDLKPANILLSAESGPAKGEARPDEPRGPTSAAAGPEVRAPNSAFRAPKITDFGLAKLIQDAEARAAGPTRTGAVMGTPSYIAPEQASGRAGAVGPAADVYALGAILYELLTGRPPFRGETPLDTVLQVMTDDPIPPRRLQPRVPRDLETVCLKCLEKDAPKRYASAADLAEDLGRFLDGRPVTAQPISSLQRGIKWARRKPALALLIVGSFVAIVAGFVFSLIVNVELQNAAERERRQAHEANRQRLIAQDRERAAAQEKQKADDARQQALRDADNARRSSYALQLAQVFSLNERDPRRATQLLEDSQRCPEEMLDFTWGYLHRLCRRERLPLAGHAIAVSAIAYAPDGAWLASAGFDRTLRVWAPQFSRAELQRIAAHEAIIRALAISPDGQTVATSGDDGRVKLWSARRPVFPLGAGGAVAWPWPVLRERASLAAHPRGARPVAFSPDGKILASGGYDGTIKLWNVATGREQATLRSHPLAVWALAFSPDGQTLASGGADRAIKIWDTKRALESFDDPLLDTLHGHEDVVMALAFSPDGKTLASGGGSNDQSLRLWEMARRRERARLKGHSRAVATIAFAPDGQAIATGSGDGTIRLWDPTTGRQRTVLQGHPSQVFSVAFSPDSLVLASGGADRAIRLWELEEHREETHVLNASPLGSVRLAPDAARVIYAQVMLVKAWDWAADRTDTLPDPGRQIDLMAVGPAAVAALDRTGFVRVWRDGRLAVIIDSRAGIRSPHAVKSLAVTANGGHVALGRADGTLQVIDAAAQKVLTVRDAHQGAIWALAFSPDGKTLASGGADRDVRLWSAGGLAPGPVLSGSAHEIRALAFAPDGQRIASGSLAGLVRLWDTRDGSNLASNTGHTDTVTCLAFTPDGKTLASGSDDRTIKLWDPQTGHERVTLAGHSEPIVHLAFAADASLLASITAEGILKIWRADPRP